MQRNNRPSTICVMQMRMGRRHIRWEADIVTLDSRPCLLQARTKQIPLLCTCSENAGSGSDGHSIQNVLSALAVVLNYSENCIPDENPATPWLCCKFFHFFLFANRRLAIEGFPNSHSACLRSCRFELWSAACKAARSVAGF